MLTFVLQRLVVDYVAMTSTTLTIEATNVDSPREGNQGALIKTDRLGRISVTPQHREALLDKFEQSGMSGQRFTELHGIKYTTFANWRQQRRVKLNQSPEVKAASPHELIDSLSEVIVQNVTSTSPPQSSALQVDLGGGVSLTIQGKTDLGLVAKLINQLRADVSL